MTRSELLLRVAHCLAVLDQAVHPVPGCPARQALLDLLHDLDASIPRHSPRNGAPLAEVSKGCR